MTAGRFEDIECLFPDTLGEALKIQADPETRAVPIAGGTDLMVQWESGALEMPPRAMHIKDLPELQEIAEVDGHLRIGSAVTHMAIRSSELVQVKTPGLAAAAATIGGYQMQCQGTLGGSIANASPAGDMAPSLMAALSAVVVASAEGERRLSMSEFCIGYRKLNLRDDELIVRFEVPVLSKGEKEGFRKLGPREAQAISKVMGAFRGRVEEGRIQRFQVALGSVAPTAIRLIDTEEWVSGRQLDEETLSGAEKRASAEVSPIDDIRSTGAYRKWVSGRLVRGFLEALR